MGKTCVICEMYLESREDYRQHLVLHDDLDRIVCAGCERQFLTLQRYRDHKSYCFPCKNCGRKFKKEIIRDEHLCLFTNGDPFQCACDQKFTKYEALKEHTKGSKPFYCCCCSQTARSLSSFMKHVRKHKENLFVKCFSCGEIAASSRLLCAHMKEVHGIEQSSRRVGCPDCGKIVSEERLIVHQARHKGLSGLCPECGKIFHSSTRLSQHLQTHHYSEPVTCDYCQKVLKTKKILSEHLKTHLKTEAGSRVAQAICPFCGLELAQKGSLARHIILVHERHRMKPDETPRTCKRCGDICPNASAYYTHLRQHKAAQERYPCQVCSRVFNKKQNLTRHMYLLHDQNRVDGVTKYSCEMCSKQTKERSTMVRHYRVVHKIDAENFELMKR